MHLYGGLAISEDGGKTFKRYSKAPILDRCKVNPYLNTSPFVIYNDNKYFMYYVSGTEWINPDLPKYNIQLATSYDGFSWKRDGHVCIDFAHQDEVALARPYVIAEDGILKMWFCHKGESYRLGYAESCDGHTWHRNDSVSTEFTSESKYEWDNEMVAYPCIFKHENYHYLLYNGNNYGHGGFGYATFKTNEP